jgi:hypothetical protein
MTVPSDREQAALAAWLDSRRTSSLSTQSEDSLLRSLDEATRDIDSSKGVTIEEVRMRVASWAGK